MTEDGDPEAKKDKKNDHMGEDGDHMTDYMPVNNHVPHPTEDQDSDKSDDAEDLTGDPATSKKERTNFVFKDSEDFEDSGYSEDTLSKNDEDLEEAIPESKEETNNIVDALCTKL